MAITLLTYVERVLLRLTKGNPQASVGIWRQAIEAGLPDALVELANRVYDSPFRGLLQKEYTIAMVSGTASLTSHADILHRALLSADIRYSLASTYALQWLPYIQDLELPHPTDYHYFALDGKGNALVVRDGDGAVPANGNLVTTTSYIPLITDVSGKTILETGLVHIGAEMNGGQAAPPIGTLAEAA